jgi:hypothetical protein
MQRNGEKRDKKSKGKVFFSPQPFCKTFLTRTFPKTFCGVFVLPLLRHAQKHHKRKEAKLINRHLILPTLVALGTA